MKQQQEQIKITLADNIKKDLEKEAARLGMRLTAYISFLLGKHVAESKVKRIS